MKRLGIVKENQAKGELKAPAIAMDQRDFGIGAQILHDLNISKLKLISNSPQTKRVGMIGYGLEIVDNVSLEIESNKHNELYLKTKRDKMGHSLKIDK